MVPECRFPSSDGKALPPPLPGFETLNLAQGVKVGNDDFFFFLKEWLTVDFSLNRGPTHALPVRPAVRERLRAA